jgi:hypothetical protein
MNELQPTSIDNCPKCNANFIGGPIPEDQQEFYGGATNWRREIGIDGGYMGLYDGTVAYKCPDCGHEFPFDDSDLAKDMFKRYEAYSGKD